MIGYTLPTSVEVDDNNVLVEWFTVSSVELVAAWSDIFLILKLLHWLKTGLIEWMTFSYWEHDFLAI